MSTSNLTGVPTGVAVSACWSISWQTAFLLVSRYVNWFLSINNQHIIPVKWQIVCGHIKQVKAFVDFAAAGMQILSRQPS